MLRSRLIMLRGLNTCLSMSFCGSGAREIFPSEHKERKGIDKLDAPRPSWLGTNTVCSCPPARDKRVQGDHLPAGSGAKLRVLTSFKNAHFSFTPESCTLAFSLYCTRSFSRVMRSRTVYSMGSVLAFWCACSLPG